MQTDGASYPCDWLIAATDVSHIQTLLPKESREYSEQYFKKKTLAISAVLAYVGLSRKIEGAVHHTLYFSDNWKQHFDAIFNTGTLLQKPSFYASFRSRSDESIVPMGMEELFLLIPVRAQLGTDPLLYEQLVEQSLEILEEKLHTDIQSTIVVKQLYTPDDFSHDYNAYNGTALGLAHTFMQTLTGRPHIESKKIRNMLYAGQWTYPGVGVPMAIVSAQIAAKKVVNYDKAHNL